MDLNNKIKLCAHSVTKNFKKQASEDIFCSVLDTRLDQIPPTLILCPSKSFKPCTEKKNLVAKMYLLLHDTSVYPPNMESFTLMIVTVGPLPSQLLWNVDAAQPSVLACQHFTNLLRSELRRTGSR